MPNDNLFSLSRQAILRNLGTNFRPSPEAKTWLMNDKSHIVANRIIDAVPGHDPLPLIPGVGDAAAQARPVLLGATLVGAAVVV